MPVRVLLAVLLALVPGCKSMGSVASGFGKVAAGAARAVPDIARGVARATPTVLRTAASVAEVMATSGEFEIGAPIEVAPGTTMSDPCQICPSDEDCGACAGFAGYACVESPAGALGRCESSAPPDAEPAPAGDASVGPGVQ